MFWIASFLAMTRSASYRIHNLLKTPRILAEVHLHLFDAGLAFVVGLGLGVQQNGNHLVGEAVLGEAADAHVPLAEFGIKLEETLRETVVHQVGEADEVGPVVVGKVKTHRVGSHLLAEALRSGVNLVTPHDLARHQQVFL